MFLRMLSVFLIVLCISITAIQYLENASLKERISRLEDDLSKEIISTDENFAKFAEFVNLQSDKIHDLSLKTARYSNLKERELDIAQQKVNIEAYRAAWEASQ